MKKILVVDDDEDILEIVEIILTSNGFDVHTYTCANTTDTNVEKVVNNYHPDLILLDISLPCKLGTEICKELKKTHDIPIILFSGLFDFEEAYAGCNADGFIRKPFEVKDFLKAINKHIK